MSKAFAFVGLGFLVFFGRPTLAQNSQVIQSLRVQANLQTDGSVNISQTLVYPQPSELAWQLFTNIHGLKISGDGTALQSNEWQTTGPTNQTLLTTTPAARSWVISYTTTTTLIRQNNIDQVYFKVFQQPGAQMSDISVIFTLPTDVPGNALTGNLYSIIGSLNPQTTVTSPHSVTYTASSAGPQTLFTVSASWPKGVLNLNKWQELRLSFLNLDALPWLLLGLVLPLITLVVLLTVLAWQKRGERVVSRVASEPPTKLAPILVGVLVNKKIHSEEIVSLLVDLCQRGYLVIVKKNGQYYLSQRKAADEHLQSWEQEILDSLFPKLGVAISAESVKEIGNATLFSGEVRDAFDQIYQISTDSEIFAENPHLTRVRYKLVALAFYFAALVGIVWMTIANASPYLLIPLVGTLALAYVIIRVSPRLIRYTPRGLTLREEWLAFGNYLATDQPLGLEATQNHVFESYLPYAIALHQTLNWANRFERSSTVIIRPDWLINYTDVGTQQLAGELVAFTDLVGQEITKMRGPLVS